MYYNCVRFHCFSIFSLGVTRGVKMTPQALTFLKVKILKIYAVALLLVTVRSDLGKENFLLSSRR